MNDWDYFERNDTGILSLADLFRRDRLPCRAEPKRRPVPGRTDDGGTRLGPQAGSLPCAACGAPRPEPAPTARA